jgi:hypothetical protein
MEEVFIAFPINTLLSCTPVVKLTSDHDIEALNPMTFILLSRKSNLK